MIGIIAFIADVVVLYGTILLIVLYLLRKLPTARTPPLGSVSPRRAGQRMELAVRPRTADERS
jgi:hypothetical protein